MKSFYLTLIFIASLFILPQQTEAQNQGVGVGAQVANPAGISFKAWLNNDHALASMVNFSISEHNSSFYAHLDYLVHKRYLNPDWDVGTLSYYYGGGARFFWLEAGLENTFWAIRLPSGLNFNVSEIPVDFYLEIAPTFEVSPDFNFGFNGGIGFRYYLN